MKYSKGSHVWGPLFSKIVHLFIKLSLSSKFTLNLAKSLIFSLNSLTNTNESAHANTSSTSTAYSYLVFVCNTRFNTSDSISTRSCSVQTRCSKLSVSESLLSKFYLNCFFLIFKFILLYVHEFIFLSSL